MQIERLGPYRIIRKIGKGGMGSVYEASEDQSGQRVAVKALSPQLAMAEGFRERFEAEIESLKKLQHEGIVRLLGYGEDDGILFYSMELVEGPSLEQELSAGRRFDWNETLGVAVQVCRALKHAHDHGVVHRDIKPANLLLAADDRVKIADFGIARLFGATQLTTAGGVLGTADYMSPEQADGRAVTEKCDQYSLGCVMYALLAGRPPFRAKSMPEMLQLQRFADPEPVRRYAPQTPEQLDRLIRQLLSKEPAQRFPNVLVLGRHMEAMQKALSRPVRPPDAPQAAATEDPHPRPYEATAAFNADATLSPDDLDLEPVDTTDSGVYSAPTLSEEPLPASGASPGAPPDSTARTTAANVAEPATSRTRFTTVDEDARRRQAEQRSHAWALAAQLALLAASVAGLGWLGWRLTRPASADDLYAEIAAHIEQEGGRDDLRAVASEIDEFLERFPADSRSGEVQSLRQDLELQKRARQVRRGGTGPADEHPIAQVFAEAMSLQGDNPDRAAALLEQLLALYPAGGEAAGELTAEQRNDLELARIELENLRAALRERQARLLPLLDERLAAAAKLEATSPAQAAAMYRALIDLYGDAPWASSVVRQARERVASLDPQR
ncbi:MAG: hypothetical protein DCC67_06260 [Planctomycetota bacterium]|nr:MAG: hypothetical protein DCC67_06260 [Planctomycetota bacterium]